MGIVKVRKGLDPEADPERKHLDFKENLEAAGGLRYEDAPPDLESGGALLSPEV